MEKRMMTLLFEMRMENVLEEELKKDKGYQDVLQETLKHLEQIEKLGLTDEQKEVIDRANSSANFLDAEYGRVAYGLGFKDGIRLAMEILK